MKRAFTKAFLMTMLGLQLTATADHLELKIMDGEYWGGGLAPVVTKGTRSRSVILPKGTWLADDGTTYTGGQTITIDVPLNRLPYFKLVK